MVPANPHTRKPEWLELSIYSGADPFGGLRAGSSGFSSVTGLSVREDVVLYKVTDSSGETRRVSATECPQAFLDLVFLVFPFG